LLPGACLQHANASELGQVLLHGVVQPQAVLLEENQHSDGGDGFAHRPDLEDGVGSHGLLRFEVLIANSTQALNPPFPGDDKYSTRELSLFDKFFQARRNRCKPLRVHPDAGRVFEVIGTSIRWLVLRGAS